MKFRRIIKAFSWLAGIALYIGLLGFSASESSEQRSTHLEINLKQPENQLFTTKGNVIDIIDNQLDSIINVPLHLINTALLEESIENHPLIREAEVYYTLDGRISIDVVQHKAIARVRAAGKDVYMDEDGKAIPRTKNHSANVPMITGHIDTVSWKESYHFLQQFDDSSWLSGQIEAIQRDSTGNYIVFPKMGRHTIIWGKPTQFEAKAKKLDVFYSYITQKGLMDSIKTLDVRFNEQVVSTKY